MEKYAFFDIDYTLYNGYITSGFYLFLADKKLINSKFVYQEDKKIGELHCSGKIDYAEETRQVVKLTAQLLKGKKEKEVEKWQKLFIKEKNKFFPWVKKLLSFLKNEKYMIYLVSAAASPSVEAIAGFLNIDRFFSSSLEVKNGIYTGRTGIILNYGEKKKLIHRIVKHLGKAKKIGFGDSKGDVEMLSSMNIAFLYNPKNEDLIKMAKNKGWYIVNKDNVIKIVKLKASNRNKKN